MKTLKDRLEEILAKTYLQHALGDRPFGVIPGSDSTNYMGASACSYKHGCSIGISMPEELREKVTNTGIDDLIQEEDVQLGLIGWELDDEERALASNVLCDIQQKHDHAAPRTDRTGYKNALELIAREHHLKLPQPLGARA